MRQLTVTSEIFALSRPFRISRGARNEAAVVVVSIAADGKVGRGECTPYPRYGESVDTTLVAIEGIRTAIEAGADRVALADLLPAGAARNAVDCALWDLEAKLSGTTLMPTKSLATAITIGIDTPEAMAAEAALLADVPLLKVKVGADDPLAMLRSIRQVAPLPRMIVDPNESWSVELLGTLMPALTELRVDLLEQPIPAADSAQLSGFARSVPICADEAAHVAADVAKLVGLYDVVNIKLDKTGGLTGALALHDAARAAGLGVMVGCMLCSSLAIAPGMVVAAGADFIDLDGPYLFAQDRIGGISFDRGMIVPPAPGFWG